MEVHNHHSHDGGHAAQTAEEALILLEYMCRHNEEHTSELKDIAALFDGDEIPALIQEAVQYYEKGNLLLARAKAKAGE